MLGSAQLLLIFAWGSGPASGSRKVSPPADEVSGEEGLSLKAGEEVGATATLVGLTSPGPHRAETGAGPVLRKP